MTRSQQLSAVPSSGLLRKLVDHPQLPEIVPRLRTPALTALIAAIGVEDAGPVIAHTTTTQLQRVFDEMLWSSLTPESTERMSARAFAQWLQVLVEQGEGFLAERLQALGLQFCVAQFAQLTEVHDVQDTLALMDEAAEVFGTYKVLARNPEDWDVVRAALVAVDGELPDFLHSVLGNITVAVRFAGTESVASTAAVDEAHDRDLRREKDGFVTRQSALEFLATARTATLEDLCDMRAYALPVRRYMATQSNAKQSEPVEQADLSDGIRELQTILDGVQVIDRTLRLEHRDARTLPLKELLDQLELQAPAAFERCLAELVYLSNVLVAGSKDLGERFNEVEAANAALSTANLGAAYLVSQHGTSIEELLQSTPGLIRAFSVGWHVLHQVAGRTARALVATLRTPAVRHQLLNRAWIVDEVDVAIADFVNKVDLAKFDEVREALSFVSLVIEPEACARLRVLIAEFPRLPTNAVPGERVNINARRIDGLEDLRDVDEFLQSLAQQVKL
ncbi:MAG: DUF6178 family protein [Pseudomonadales bacterium]